MCWGRRQRFEVSNLTKIHADLYNLIQALHIDETHFTAGFSPASTHSHENTPQSARHTQGTAVEFSALQTNWLAASYQGYIRPGIKQIVLQSKISHHFT